MLTLQYAQDNGAIGLTQTKAFKRTFVKWAAESFDWLGMSAEELFCYNKVLNEYEFPPLELLHFLLTKLKLGRHCKGEFWITKRGKELAQHPSQLFAELIPFFVLSIDHSSYSRFDEPPFGNWDVWLNMMNVEMDQGAMEQQLYAVFYEEEAGWDNANWRALAQFSACVLKPLEWAGLIVGQREDAERMERYYFKTPLWRAALKLETDDKLQPLSVQ